jgi:hypothetical protein
MIDENRGGEDPAIILGCLAILDGEVIQGQAVFASIVLLGLSTREDYRYPGKDLHLLLLVNQYHRLHRPCSPVMHREDLLYILVAEEGVARL